MNASRQRAAMVETRKIKVGKPLVRAQNSFTRTNGFSPGSFARQSFFRPCYELNRNTVVFFLKVFCLVRLSRWL